MGTALLLTGLLILLVLGLLVTVVYNLVIILDDARTHDTIAKDSPGQRRFLSASILNYLIQLEE